MNSFIVFLLSAYVLGIVMEDTLEIGVINGREREIQVPELENK